MGYGESFRVQVGARISNLRKNKGISQRAFAQMLDISPQYVCAFESGKKPISDDHTAKIAKIFGITEKQLLFSPLKDDSQVTDDMEYIFYRLKDCPKVESEMLINLLTTYLDGNNEVKIKLLKAFRLAFNPPIPISSSAFKAYILIKSMLEKYMKETVTIKEAINSNQ